MFAALAEVGGKPGVMSWGVPGSLSMDGFHTVCPIQMSSTNNQEAEYRGCPSWYRSGLLTQERSVVQSPQAAPTTAPNQSH
mmetsp:Transcript_49380/g.120511  ORF Transcript_49380/g.120511 Transcript_49380/m.120511 type:complete len:81 (-) Transcript_49380:490-732(-)